MTNINFLGTYTLYTKEVKRYLKVYNQTLIIPVVNALLFLAIFNLALGDRVQKIGGLNFSEFMASGLVMMALMQNSFANSSSSLIMGKVLGTLIDYLMPPLSAGEINFAMVLASTTRGVLVGILVAVSISFFVPLGVHNVFIAAYFLISAAVLLSLFGILAGIIAETFDQMAAVNSYLITPLTFLSGTFYSVKNLPEFWYNISQFNPFFYMIDGFRYGITGYADSNIVTGMLVMIFCNLSLWFITYFLLRKGWRIKS